MGNNKVEKSLRVGSPIVNGIASELLATDANKKLQTLAVATYPSLTELTYVKGVTSAIQTQLDGKSPTAGNASLVTVGTITAGVWNGTDVPVSAGGTGLSTISALSIWLANTLNTVTEVTPGAGNSIRINAGGTAWEAFTPGGGGISWTEVTGTTQAAIVNNGYVANNAALVTITLPDTAAVGSIVRVAGVGAGGWKLAQNASEIIHFGSLASTTGVGGYLASSNQYDAVEVVCIVANTEWSVISSIGNITVV